MDVDGTLTDGRIFIGAQGELMKAFDVRDGCAIAYILPTLGIESVIITGRRSEIVQQRAKELGITLLYQGVFDKVGRLKQIAEEWHASADESAYIGDDLNNLDYIRYCGCTACPGDAVEEAKACVTYVCQKEGEQSESLLFGFRRNYANNSIYSANLAHSC